MGEVRFPHRFLLLLCLCKEVTKKAHKRGEGDCSATADSSPLLTLPILGGVGLLRTACGARDSVGVATRGVGLFVPRGLGFEQVEFWGGVKLWAVLKLVRERGMLAPSFRKKALFEQQKSPLSGGFGGILSPRAPVPPLH